MSGSNDDSDIAALAQRFSQLNSQANQGSPQNLGVVNQQQAPQMNQPNQQSPQQPLQQPQQQPQQLNNQFNQPNNQQINPQVNQNINPQPSLNVQQQVNHFSQNNPQPGNPVNDQSLQQPLQQPQQQPLQQPQQQSQQLNNQFNQQSVNNQSVSNPPVNPQNPGAPISPLDALKNLPDADEEIKVVEVEGPDDEVVNEEVVSPQPAPEQDSESVIDESLEELKEEYDDTKLDSIIIDQVKELIEIDNNLNNKIEDLRVDLKKEVEEREKLAKRVESHYAELKDLEKSIRKFIALYELITNQYNPFVNQDDEETRKRMKELTEGLKKKEQALNKELMKEGSSGAESSNNLDNNSSVQAVSDSSSSEDKPPHFVTRDGKEIHTLSDLVTVMKEMPQDEFEHHVTPHKNDFAAWLHHSLNRSDLAQKIGPLKSKEEIIRVLEGELKE